MSNEPASLGRSRAAALPASWAVSGALADFMALTKPRLNFLVVATTVAGYYLAADRFDPARLFNTVVGTALVAGGAAAFNELLERDTDALMRRTRLRPLPDGRMRASTAGWFAAAIAALGLAELWLGANLLAAGVAFATLCSYALVYTPLKRRTSLSTLVGGIPGALPPMIGWAAAADSLPLGAVVCARELSSTKFKRSVVNTWVSSRSSSAFRFPLVFDSSIPRRSMLKRAASRSRTIC